MPKRINYEPNQIFNGLILLEEIPTVGVNRVGKFKCTCGNTFITQITNVKHNHTKSCGCYAKTYLITHGASKRGKRDPLYDTWGSIIQRCTNENAFAYKYYGSRGINICIEWLNDFNLFKSYILQVLGDKPTSKHTIDRINNNKGYEPGNLRWATMLEQSRNKRPWNSC